MAGGLSLDEHAERNADGCGPEAGTVGGPGPVSHLDARHAIPRHPSRRLSALFPLSCSPTHVYKVYAASAGETVCGAARSAAELVRMSSLGLCRVDRYGARRSCRSACERCDRASRCAWCAPDRTLESGGPGDPTPSPHPAHRRAGPLNEGTPALEKCGTLDLTLRDAFRALRIREIAGASGWPLPGRLAMTRSAPQVANTGTLGSSGRRGLPSCWRRHLPPILSAWLARPTPAV